MRTVFTLDGDEHHGAGLVIGQAAEMRWLVRTSMFPGADGKRLAMRALAQIVGAALGRCVEAAEPAEGAVYDTTDGRPPPGDADALNVEEEDNVVQPSLSRPPTLQNGRIVGNAGSEGAATAPRDRGKDRSKRGGRGRGTETGRSRTKAGNARVLGPTFESGARVAKAAKKT